MDVIEYRYPNATALDKTLPIFLPSLGTSELPSHRWAARSLAGIAVGDPVLSWPDGGAASVKDSLIPNGRDTGPDGVPHILRKDATSGELYSHLQGLATVTFAAATDLVTTNITHGLAVDETIQFSDVTGVAGVAAKTTYYVKTVPSTTTLTLSATKGGSTLDITADGTGNWAQALSIPSVEQAATEYKTVYMLVRRVSQSSGGVGTNGFFASFGGAIVASAGALITVTGGTNVTPAAVAGWHIIVVRFNGTSSDMWVDGVKSTATSTLGATVLGATNFSLASEVSSHAFAPNDYIEVGGFSSILSDADVVALRAGLKTAYSALPIP